MNSLLNTPTSHSQCLRMRLSNAQWTPNRFIDDKVPFSVRNGPMFAKRLVHAYQACVKDLPPPKNHYNVAEFGAGLGLLSYHFLTQLKIHDPTLYRHTHLYITEQSDALINALNHLTLLTPHASKYTILKMDATALTFPPNTRLHFCISNYLIDALNTIQISYTPTALYEIKVTSTLPSHIHCLDPSQYPPKAVTLTEFLNLTLTDTGLLQNAPAPILDHLIETYTLHPLTTQLPPSDQTLINTLLNTQSDPITVNIPTHLETHLSQVNSYLAPNGIYIISDIGFTTPTPNLSPQDMISVYRQSTFYAVWFGYLIAHANAHALDTWITDDTHRDTQECILKNGVLTPTQKDEFKDIFKDVGYEEVSHAISKIHPLIPNPDYLNTLTQLLSSLSTEDKDDYFLLITLATQLLTDGYDSEAEKYATHTLDQYGDPASEAYRLLGCIYQKKNDHIKAIHYLKKSLIYLPDDPISHSLIGLSEMASGQFKTALKHFKKAIPKASQSDIPKHLLAIAICLRNSNQHPALTTLTTHIQALSTTHPTLIPPEITHRISKQAQMQEIPKTPR